VHVACGHGSVLLQHGDKIARVRGNFEGCPGHSKALAIFAAAVAAAFTTALGAAFATKGISQSPTPRDHSAMSGKCK